MLAARGLLDEDRGQGGQRAERDLGERRLDRVREEDGVAAEEAEAFAHLGPKADPGPRCRALAAALARRRRTAGDGPAIEAMRIADAA